MPTIRSLKASDAPALHAIIEKVNATSRYPLGPHWSFEQTEEECRQSGWICVHTVTSEIEAFVLFRESLTAIEISFLATVPEAQRDGRMTHLLNYLIDHRETDRPIWLEVHEKNQPARQLYGRLGFKQVGRRPNYYPEKASAILYTFDAEAAGGDADDIPI